MVWEICKSSKNDQTENVNGEGRERERQNGFAFTLALRNDLKARSDGDQASPTPSFS